MDLKFGTPGPSPTHARVSRTAPRTHRRQAEVLGLLAFTKFSLAICKVGRITARGAAHSGLSARSSVQETYKRSPLQHEGTATSSDGALSSGDGDGKSQQTERGAAAAHPRSSWIAG